MSVQIQTADTAKMVENFDSWVQNHWLTDDRRRNCIYGIWSVGISLLTMGALPFGFPVRRIDEVRRFRRLEYRPLFTAATTVTGRVS